MTSSPNPAPERPSGARTGDAERIVKLALCVKEHPGITFAEIRDALPGEYGALPSAGTDDQRRRTNAARRAFERDKETLRSYGIVIVEDGNARYSIDAEASYAAPVDLTDAEASLLRLLCNALLEDPSYPFKSELRMVLAKIGDDIDVPDLLPSMVGNENGGGRPVTGLKKARKAIAARKRLSFEYRDAHGRASSREVEPFGCFILDKNCYIVAFDPSAAGAGETGGERVFRLDRMEKVHVNGKSPGTPDFAPRAFDATRYYGLPFQFGDGEFEAEVAFDAENAWRAERLRMGQGRLELQSGNAGGESAGGVVWTVKARDAEALARWCVENGPGIVPVSPRGAREAYFAGINAVLESLAGGAR